MPSFKKVMTIRLMSIVSSTTFLFQRPNYKKAMPIVLPTPFLFQRSTSKSRVGKNSNMNFTLLLVFSMALKTVAIPVQSISEDSLMVSQNNANGSPKFRLKVQRNMSCTKSKPFESNASEYLCLLTCTLNHFRMIDTIITLSLNHKQSFLESFNQKTLKSQCLNS